MGERRNIIFSNIQGPKPILDARTRFLPTKNPRKSKERVTRHSFLQIALRFSSKGKPRIFWGEKTRGRGRY
jgi:hypothetical protein